MGDGRRLRATLSHLVPDSGRSRIRTVDLFRGPLQPFEDEDQLACFGGFGMGCRVRR